MKQQIISEKIRQPNGHFSQATVIEARGKLVFISGMTSRRPDGTIAGIGDIEAQTKQVCENIKAAVEAAGGTMDDIVRVDVYVRNMEHFEKIHKVRRKYFKAPWKMSPPVSPNTCSRSSTWAILPISFMVSPSVVQAAISLSAVNRSDCVA